MGDDLWNFFSNTCKDVRSAEYIEEGKSKWVEC